MEGGTPTEIDLDSGLDVKSSDMLVNVHSPTFQHNWQKYQGRYLPNSLRFEKNGYAAGWNVYNFEFNIKKYYHETGRFWLSYDYESIYAKMLNLYAYEDDARPTKSYAVVNTTQDLDGVFTVLNNKQLITHVADSGSTGTTVFITWHPDTKTFEVTENYAAKYELQEDYSSILTVWDTRSTFDAGFTLYKYSNLTGDAFDTEFTYKSFKNNRHNWVDFKLDFSSDTPKVSTPEDGTVANVQLTGYNTLTFDYTVTKNAYLYLDFIADRYYLTFTYKDVVNIASEEKLIIAGAADNAYITFNKFTNWLASNNKTIHARAGVWMTPSVYLPVWFSLSIDFSNSWDKNDTRYFDNCAGITFRIPSLDPDKAGVNNGLCTFPTLKSQSVFEPGTVRTTILRASLPNYVRGSLTPGVGSYLIVDNISADPYEPAPIPDRSNGMKYRCNHMWINNFITIPTADGSTPYKVNVHAGKQFIGGSGAWSVITNLGSMLFGLYKSMFGDTYYSYATASNDWCKVDLSTLFDRNDVLGINSSAWYTIKDISSIQSVKLKTVTASVNLVGDDVSYMKSAVGGFKGLWESAVMKPSSVTPQVYNTAQPARTYDELYTDGVYKFNTFEPCTAEYEDQATFWPFPFVPKFNYKKQVGTNPQTQQPIYTEIRGVYYVDTSGRPYTFEQFKATVLGEYTATTAFTWVDPTSSYSRHRIVHTVRKGFSDWVPVLRSSYTSDEEFAKDRNGFDAKWKLYFGDNVPNPHSYFNIGINTGDYDVIPANDDRTYEDFTDITIVDESNSVVLDFVTMGQAMTDNSSASTGHRLSCEFNYKDSTKFFTVPVAQKDPSSGYYASSALAAMHIFHQYARNENYYKNITFAQGKVTESGSGAVLTSMVPIMSTDGINNAGSVRCTALEYSYVTGLNATYVSTTNIKQTLHTYAINCTYSTTDKRWSDDTSSVKVSDWMKFWRISFEGIKTVGAGTSASTWTSRAGQEANARVYSTPSGRCEYHTVYNGKFLYSIPLKGTLGIDLYHTNAGVATELDMTSNTYTYSVDDTMYRVIGAYTVDWNYSEQSIYLDRKGTDTYKGVKLFSTLSFSGNNPQKADNVSVAYCSGIIEDSTGKSALRMVYPFSSGQTFLYAKERISEETGESVYSKESMFFPKVTFDDTNTDFEYDDSIANVFMLDDAADLGGVSYGIQVDTEQGVYFSTVPAARYELYKSSFDTMHRYFVQGWYNSNVEYNLLPETLVYGIDPVTGKQSLSVGKRTESGVFQQSASYEINRDGILRSQSTKDVTDTLTSPLCTNTVLYAKDRAISLVDGNNEPVNSIMLCTTCSVSLSYPNNKAKFIKADVTSPSGMTLTEYDGQTGSATFTGAPKTVTYNYYSKIITNNCLSQMAWDFADYTEVSAELADMTVGSIALRGMYEGSLADNNAVSFSYLDTDYTVNLSVFNNLPKQIDITSTDVRTPDTTKVLATIDPEKELQIVKQQWNTTTEVEDFWWISENLVLVLTKRQFILRRKVRSEDFDDFDDWNGDQFDDVYTCSRSSILPTTVRAHFVPNMYNRSRAATNIFITVTPVDSNSMLFKFYDPYDQFKLIKSETIKISKIQLGVALNRTNNVLNTYTSGLTPDYLMAHATWSSTYTSDNYVIIGCHYDNNFNQWALVFSGSLELVRIIQGYGYVGLNGALTGGQIPTTYFDVSKGFNNMVKPLSALDTTPADTNINNIDAEYLVNSDGDFNTIVNAIYGTDTQQWYVCKRLSGIVSHLEYTGNGLFAVKSIPLINNYAAQYKSPSFGSSVLGDNKVEGKKLSELFKNGASDLLNSWKDLTGLVGNPNLYVYSPRYSTLMYLQQTLGQYAYVHYNSSNSAPKVEPENVRKNEDPAVRMSNELQAKATAAVLSSEYTFGKQVNKQTLSVTSINELSKDFFFFNLLSGLAEGISAFDFKASVNSAQAQSAINDFGRKFETMFVENVGNLLSSSIVTQSKTKPAIASVITGIKSLDMFYSTSANQRVFAGPGFVEHQFVADCVAQSVTDVQVEGKTIQFLWILPSVTSYIKRKSLAVTEQIINGLLNQASAWAGDKFTGAIATAIILVANGLQAAVTAARVALTSLDDILANLAGKGASANVDSTVTEHRLTVEGKHKYGEKSETFMWPCYLGNTNQLTYTSEEVCAALKCTPWELNLLPTVINQSKKVYGTVNIAQIADLPRLSTNRAVSDEAKEVYGGLYTINAVKGIYGSSTADTTKAVALSGDIPYYQAVCYGKATDSLLPAGMACVIGAKTILPDQAFKNENINVSEPAFTPSLIHDYIVEKSWDISQTCTYGLCQWVSVKDTKVTNCPPSNMIINSSICLIATPYEAIEVFKTVSKNYMRPFTITPNALAFNTTGYNTIFDNKLYHAFDGMSQRIVSMVGAPGLSKSVQSFVYALQVNDRFKRSNIIPANEVQGNFKSPPVMAMDAIDPVWTCVTVASEGRGLEAGTIGEDKDAVRWSIPMFTEPVSTLPAVVKTMTASPLAVVDGVTSLVTTKVTDTNARYKAPVSVDFAIGKNLYRATSEYICSITNMDAGSIVTELIPIDGLTYIGATPTEAFFYSQASRSYYIFTGSALTKMDMLERFRNIQRGYWDFVNQEVVMPSLMTFTRLDPDIKDTDSETDNIIVPVLSKSNVSGELPPPLTTIFNDRSWYKVYSLPSGLVYQGPNRVIINRSIFTEYMTDSIKGNFGKWAKLNKEDFSMHREYVDKYNSISHTVSGVDGWTYNPFVLVTSPLGVSENTDCMFEWEITFCWPVEMDLLYGSDNYACVNIMADTMTPGGKLQSRPTHVYLTKELFTNSGNYGYYSFRYQSKNGAGNRERLRIWSDQYIAISGLTCETKVITSRRTQVLTQQVDVQNMKEL